MIRDPKKGNDEPNAIGDFVISGSQLGVGTTENLSTLTVRARVPFNLTGTLTSTDESATVTGTGTLFLTELSVGDVINVGTAWDSIKGVVAIASDTELTVDSPYVSGAANQTVQAMPSAARFDDNTGNAQVSVNGQGNVGIGTTGARASLEVFGTGAGNYYACPVGVRIHNTQASDAWQLVLSAEATHTQPGALVWVTADCDDQSTLTFSTFGGDELHDSAVDRVRINGTGFQSLTGFAIAVDSVSQNYTADGTAHYLLVDAGTAGVTITLPPAGNTVGRTFSVVKFAGAGTVTVAAASGENINGAATKEIETLYERLELVSTGGPVWVAHVMAPA